MIAHIATEGGAAVIRMTGTEPEDSARSIARLLQLQNDLVARLSEETMRYLRGLQGIVGPAVPGTVIRGDSDDALHVEGIPGEAVHFSIEVSNEQGVYAAVAPALSPLVAHNGATWFPQAHVTPAYQLVAPHETARVAVEVMVPAELPPGDYCGALFLQGAGHGTGVAVQVPTPPAQNASPEPAVKRAAAKPARTSASRAGRKKSSGRAAEERSS